MNTQKKIDPQISNFRKEYYKYVEEYIQDKKLKLILRQDYKATIKSAWFYYDFLPALPKGFKVIHKPLGDKKNSPGVALEIKINEHFHKDVKSDIEDLFFNDEQDVENMAFRPAKASFSVHIATPPIDSTRLLCEQHDSLDKVLKSMGRLQGWYHKNQDYLSALLGP